MESGAECVTAAWQNFLHVESSQNTMNKRKQTHAHTSICCDSNSSHLGPPLTCTLQMSRHPPSWAGSRGPGARLLFLSLQSACTWLFSQLLSPTPCLAAGCEISHASGPLTWIFSTFVPLDEAHDEQDQDEERDGAHQPDEPSLSGDVHLPVGCGWTHRRETVSTGCHFYFRAAKKKKKAWDLLSSCWWISKDAGTEI